MPKTILIISPHSFVDLITNSSSELFVCDTKKSLKAVQELLQVLLANHDKISEETHAFNCVFGKIEAVDYTFEWYDVPEPIRREYESCHRYCAYGRRQDAWYSDDHVGNAAENDLEEKERELRKTFGSLKSLNSLYEENKSEYNRRWEMFRKEADILWTDFGAKVFRSENDLFLDFLRQNNFTKKQIETAKEICEDAVREHLSQNLGRFPRPITGKFPDKLEKAYQTFYQWKSWGITAKKGAIMVHSADDNSIPYEMFGTIESYLNADRYHLG